MKKRPLLSTNSAGSDWVFKKKKKENQAGAGTTAKDRRRAFVCTMNGTGELNIENYGSLGDYNEEKIVLHCYKCKMVIEGERLLIEYFKDIDMRITGNIHSIHF